MLRIYLANFSGFEQATCSFLLKNVSYKGTVQILENIIYTPFNYLTEILELYCLKTKTKMDTDLRRHILAL